MSEAAKRFFDFMHRNENNPRIVESYNRFIELASAMCRAENCGFVLDPDSVEEACERALMEGIHEER